MNLHLQPRSDTGKFCAIAGLPMIRSKWDAVNPWNPQREQELEGEFRSLQRNVVEAERLIREWRGRMNSVAVELEQVQKLNERGQQAVLPLRGIAVPKPKRGAYSREKTVLTSEVKAVHIGRRMQDACVKRLGKGAKRTK